MQDSTVLNAWICGQVAADQDAPIRRGSFPLVTISVGLGLIRANYSLLALDLASQGYIVAMVESPEGVANAAGIAGVDGIDGLLIGTSDLTAEMGISGQILHPRVEEAYRSVGAACRKAGKFLGMGGVYEPDAMKHYAGAQLHSGRAEQEKLECIMRRFDAADAHHRGASV